MSQRHKGPDKTILLGNVQVPMQGSPGRVRNPVSRRNAFRKVAAGAPNQCAENFTLLNN
ncbi:hypothetical protein BDB00DRAFT_94408 [Zychaea mexicana]|uniref:uncharacterized protein n=1 Tax=Zychaea mexicana TaxID=64656 RepID=UPI0022FE488E|nr:uncharacterized protein BDB00DRAFT_94408 [Zychaea mexicana]KAI9485039.1 hypothetical protein BDB00DRAFT_94408 [Zychaea mexicana]